ncbi:MAG: transposase [Bradyrhizobium sp.]
MLDHTLKPEPVRRLEVITGTGRRRRFSGDYKARIVEETLAPGAVISDVARRHGLTPQQLFTWRRQARQPAVKSTGTEAALFVPAVVETGLRARAARGRQRKRTRQVDRSSGIIEVEIEGVTVRIGRGAEAKAVAAILRALKAGT